MTTDFKITAGKYFYYDTFPCSSYSTMQSSNVPGQTVLEIKNKNSFLVTFRFDISSRSDKLNHFLEYCRVITNLSE